MRIEQNPALPNLPINGAANHPATPLKGPAFADLLARAGTDIQLSRHAQKRVDRRDLDLDTARLQRLDTAISRAAEKGARNSIVMLDELAMVVDVRGRTIVTAMPREGGEPRVFTNVDSVVIA